MIDQDCQDEEAAARTREYKRRSAAAATTTSVEDLYARAVRFSPDGERSARVCASFAASDEAPTIFAMRDLKVRKRYDIFAECLMYAARRGGAKQDDISRKLISKPCTLMGARLPRAIRRATPGAGTVDGRARRVLSVPMMPIWRRARECARG